MKPNASHEHLEDAMKSTVKKVIRDFWTPYLLDRYFKGDSPPEKFFAVILNIVLFDKVIDGKIQIVQHDHLRTRDGRREIRPDFTITSQGSRERFVLECDGYNFHRRTKEEFDRELKRERELVLQGFKVIRYSATELFEDPWHCAFEVVGAISSSLADGRADFQINETIRELIKIETQSKDDSAGSESTVKEVLKKIMMLHETYPYPTYTDCRRYLLGTRSRRGLAKLASIPGYGDCKRLGIDRNLLKIAYGQFQVLISKGKAPDRQVNSDCHPSKDLEEACRSYCERHLPSDGQHKEIRLKHKRAYLPWREEEEQLLLGLIEARYEIAKISTLMQRQPTSIKSRADKLLGDSTSRIPGDG